MEKIFGDLNTKEVKKIEKIADKVMALESKMAALTDDELRGKTQEFKDRLAAGETLDDILPEAFDPQVAHVVAEAVKSHI